MKLEQKTTGSNKKTASANCGGKTIRLIPALLQLFFSLAVLGCGIAIAAYYLKTTPQPKSRKREQIPLTVQVESAKYGPHQVIISAMGTIIPAREITLTSQVRGEIVQLNSDLIPGGLITKGVQLLKIDPRDYQLVVLQRKNDVAEAKSHFALEMGNQLIAQKEFEILGEQTTDDEQQLMLRQPQLDHRRAALKGAEAKLSQAELNLTRTRINAPFNAVILSRSVNIGSFISETTSLARLAGTDEFWLKLSVPINQLQWLHIPTENSDTGSSVKIIVGNSHDRQITRMGRLLRLAPDLEKEGRMAVLYISIKDPLCRLAKNKNNARLLIGSYVKAEVEGLQIDSAVAIKRSYIHDSDTLWLFSEENKLAIRKINIAFKNRDYVFITSGIVEGERIITSPLSAPVAGMSIRLWNPDKNKDKDSPPGTKP